MSTSKFPSYKQLDQMDCGPTCLRIISKFFGRAHSIESLRRNSHITREGVFIGGIAEAAEKIGFHTLAVNLDFKSLEKEVPLPCIAYWRQRHFIVIYKITKDKVYVSDPAHGLLKYSKQEFINGWIGKRAKNNSSEGYLLLFEPTPKFYENDAVGKKEYGFGFLLQYFKPHQKSIYQLFLGLLVGSLLQLIFPFLTQAVVDYGINYQNLNFIYLILALK